MLDTLPVGAQQCLSSPHCRHYDPCSVQTGRGYCLWGAVSQHATIAPLLDLLLNSISVLWMAVWPRLLLSISQCGRFLHVTVAVFSFGCLHLELVLSCVHVTDWYDTTRLQPASIMLGIYWPFRNTPTHFLPDVIVFEMDNHHFRSRVCPISFLRF